MDIRKALISMSLLTFLTLGFQNCGETGFVASSANSSPGSVAVGVQPQMKLGDDYLLSAPLEMSEENLFGESSDVAEGADSDVLELEDGALEPLGNELSDVSFHIDFGQLEGQLDLSTVETVRLRFQGFNLNPRSFVWSPSEFDQGVPESLDFTLLTGVSMQVGGLIEFADGNVYATCTEVNTAGGEQHITLYFEGLGVLAPSDLVESMGSCQFDPAL